MKCSEKTEVRGFGFCERRESHVLHGRKRLRDEECGSGDQMMALWLTLNEIWKSKMEIPVKILRITARKIGAGCIIRLGQEAKTET